TADEQHGGEEGGPWSSGQCALHHKIFLIPAFPPGGSVVFIRTADEQHGGEEGGPWSS
ncbi:hypothetical protein KUCAC02_013258, partial [Chaenocephalus aceratus]